MRVWTGRVLSALTVMFMLFDGSVKLLMWGPALEANAKLGYPEDLVFAIGVLELACTAVYVIPQTSVFGAILMTGFLGGAIATHVRVSDPLFSHTLFPVYVGAMAWLGLYLRNDRLRAIIPLSKPA